MHKAFHPITSKLNDWAALPRYGPRPNSTVFRGSPFQEACARQSGQATSATWSFSVLLENLHGRGPLAAGSTAQEDDPGVSR